MLSKKSTLIIKSLERYQNEFSKASERHQMASIIVKVRDDDLGRVRVKGPEHDHPIRTIYSFDETINPPTILNLKDSKELRGIFLLCTNESLKAFQLLANRVGMILLDMPNSVSIPPECSISNWIGLWHRWLLYVHSLSLRPQLGSAIVLGFDCFAWVGDELGELSAVWNYEDEIPSYLFSACEDTFAASVDAIDILLSQIYPSNIPEDNTRNKGRKKKRIDTQSRMAQAVMILMKHPDWSNRQIAQEVGVSHTSLGRYDTFRRMREYMLGKRAEGTGDQRPYETDNSDEEDAE